MADPLSDLRAAGFDDAEISQWAATKRQTLTDAGFKDNEVDAYLAGGPVVPNEIPLALDKRLQDGHEARKREGGLLQTVPAFIDLLKTPDGRTKLWDAVSAYPSEFIKGTLEQVAVPGEVAQGKLDLSTSDGMDKAIGLGTLIGLGRLSKPSVTGKTSGLSIAQGETMARIDRAPTGEIVDTPIGGLPSSSDFTAARNSMFADTPVDPAPVNDKMLRLYTDHGIHPAEVAHDAEHDVTVSQDLLSKSNDLPQRYMAAEVKSDTLKGDVAETKTSVPSVGGDGEKPPAPPETPSGSEPPQSPRDQILAKIDVGGKDASAPFTLDRLYTQALDNLHPIKSVSDEAYVAARLTRGQFGKAQQFLEHGTFDFNTLETSGKSLKEVLAPVRDNLDDIRAYLASKRAVEIEESGRKSGMDLEAAKQVIKDGQDKYEAIAKQLSQYQAQVLKYLKDSGVLSDKSLAAMEGANKNYVPFYRVMGDYAQVSPGGKGAGKGFGPGNPIKKLKGSERDIVDPLESIIKNTYAYISVAERNAVGAKIIEGLKKSEGEKGIEIVKRPSIANDADIAGYLAEQGVKDAPKELIDLIKSAGRADEGDTISAWVNGIKETVKVKDAELVKSFRGLNTESANMLVKILSVPAKTLRAGAVMTPDFIARNLIRDFMTAFVNTKSGIFTPLDTLKGLKSAITKDTNFQNWLKSGGANATLVSLDRRYLQESLQKLTADTGLMDRAWNVVKSPLSILRVATELAENATRLGEFKKDLKGATTKEAIQSAGFASREVTLDFARIGASMRAYNMITAFANAQIQGVDRIVRAFKDKPVSTTLKVAGGITLPSVLLWFANHDDPRYKELPAWQKDLFWIVLTKDHIFRVPKPFELGVVFGSGVERALDATIGENKEAFEHFSSSVISAFTPSFVPTAAIPMVEQFANRSSFTDRTLIPADVEKQLPEYQYTPYTTELTKKLGQIIGAFPGMRDQSLETNSFAGGVARAMTSPILMENYVRAWSGSLGVYALQAADASLRKAGVLPDPVLPASTLADIPFVKAFVVRYPSASAQSIQDFYDDYTKNKKYYDTWMAKAQEGDELATNHILDAGGPRLFLQLDGIKGALSEHSQLIRDIYKNPSIPADEKRQLIDTLYYSMIEVGQAGKQMMRQISETAATAH